MIDERKNVQTPPPAPTASAIGPGSLPSTFAPPDHPQTRRIIIVLLFYVHGKQVKKEGRKMLLMLFYLFVVGQCQEKSTLDICRCEADDKMVMCVPCGESLILTRDTPGCHSKALVFWVTGEVVATGCEFYDDSTRDVYIQRTTFSCEDSRT